MRLRSMGARRALVASALLALAALTVVAGGSAARTPEASGADGIIDAQWTPVGLRDAKTTVVLQMAGNPVTVVEADAGRELSTGEKSAIKADLKGKQDAIAGQIQALGGQVLADYQVAYNGVKVRIDRSKLDSLKALKGVTAVRGLSRVVPDNVKGVQLIGAPSVWGGLAALHGENIKVAVIDTGIDYTHANFGGPGTIAAFNAANAADTLPPSVAFGWGARVKGGIDLVGDDYNADPDDPAFQPVPHPDPNPLDCNGHGSHVAGSAAGSGVTAAGATYNGPYNATTITGNSWTIGPGVAPKADIYGIRVFGCEGSTDVTVDAIEWAVDHDMDVINMSLGSSFGTTEDPSAVASTNAAKAGVIVVTSAGNSGPSQYITGSPGTAEGAISTAAIDAAPNFPAAVDLDPERSDDRGERERVRASADGHVHRQGDRRRPGHDRRSRRHRRHALGGRVARLRRAVVRRPAAAEHDRGRQPRHVRTRGEGDLRPAGRSRGRRDGQQRHRPAAGRGPDHVQPGHGTPFNVTIPFLGVRGLPTTPTSDGGRLRAANGQSATRDARVDREPELHGLRELLVGRPARWRQRPEAEHLGSRRRDRLDRRRHRQRPGDDLRHLDGLAARGGRRRTDAAGASDLERRGHQGGDHEHRRPVAGDGDHGFRISRGGTGLVQPAKSTATQVVALASNDRFAISVNYGFEELKSNFSKTRTIRLNNNGTSAATFNISVANQAGSPHTLAVTSGGLDRRVALVDHGARREPQPMST